MLEFLKEIIKEAGYIAKGYYLKGVKQDYKGNRSNVVTEADREVERFLVAKIKERYPDHGIISEETEEEHNPGAEYTWVIDPVDGTRNFANHIAMWCTLVGITKNGEPYMGAVYDAMNDELFYAEKGKGAYLNDNRIQVNNFEKIDHCFLVFSPGGGYGTGMLKYKEYQTFYNNINGDKGHWIHNYGTMLPLCHLAAGRLDAWVHNAGMYHDQLAPIVIATEAGARCTTSDGEEWEKGRMDIVIANPALHAELLKMF